MDRPRRTHAQARAEMREGILRLGRQQLASRGAADLSVREIARGLGVASSAIYRHVSSRDELLTMLLVDAYEDLSAHVAAAVDAASGPAQQLTALATSMRAWAVADPARWGLIYGTPVPGYAAPAEQTTVPGTRVMARFVEVLGQGDVPDGAFPAPDLAFAQALRDGLQDLGMEIDTVRAAAAVSAWVSLVGTISAEIFGQLGSGFDVIGDELVRRWVARTTATFGLG
jgi:AcrR family transcriptional regulator